MSVETMTIPTTTIRVPAGEQLWLHADVATPPDAKGTILFVHGSGSSRKSPRNQLVASAFHAAGFATVRVDLLTLVEERLDAQTTALRFDVPLLTARVVHIVDWLRCYDLIGTLPIGLYGASTGAAAALDTAAARPEIVRAVVSRGGRVDLAAHIEAVTAPTLLIVGGRDPEGLDQNEKALARLNGVKRLEIVPGAKHLFDEPGTLDDVAALAEAWFEMYLR